MVKKPKRRPAKKTAPSVELIVRRGARARFQKLKQKTAHLPVKVAWDRRGGERRAVTDQVNVNRRKSDRRGNPPFTWELGDFVLVEKVRRGHKKGGRCL
jgi:hypothetical protein